MAQFVEAREIVYEDILQDEDSSLAENIQSMASEAGDRFSEITRAVSEALLKPTSTQGSVGSVTSLAAERYSKAISAASAALYGSQHDTREDIASIASSRYADAVSA
jgi:DNA anti-recombination protein RmuC